MGEAHLPAQQPQAQEEARVPVPDADPSGACGAQGAPQPRPLPPVGLIHRVRRRDVFAEFARAPVVRRGPVWVRTTVIGADVPQLAFAVGRRTGSAVVRNRVRRRLRAAAREVGLAPRTAYLVGTGPGAGDVAYPEMVAALRACVGGVRDR
jgi:ribonuclease P protein component